MRVVVMLCCLLGSILPALGQSGYPKPTQMKNVLFYIQHNRNTNTYIYELRKTMLGDVDAKNPIKVYRQMFEENAEIKALSVVQRNFAYGISSTPLDKNTYEATIVSLPSQKFYLRVKSKTNFYVETTVNGNTFKLDRIFLHLKEGTSGLSTKTDYIIFYGRKDNKPVAERMEIE